MCSSDLTARVMTSGGNRYPAKAELGAGRTGGCRRDLIARVSLMPTPTANATVPPDLAEKLARRLDRKARAAARVAADAEPIRVTAGPP